MRSLFFMLIVILIIFIINKYYTLKNNNNNDNNNNDNNNDNDNTIKFLLPETNFSDYFRITNIDNMYKDIFTELIKSDNEINSNINMQNNFVRF